MCLSKIYQKNNISKVQTLQNFLHIFDLIKKKITQQRNLSFTCFIRKRLGIKKYKVTKGALRKISSEMYKILKLSTFFFLILDIRNPIGTWNQLLVKKILSSKKNIVVVLNKIDLVPAWITSKWLKIFSKKNITIPFHSIRRLYFGKNLLLEIIRNIRYQNFLKKILVIGIIGNQGVGKSQLVSILKKQIKTRSPSCIKNKQLFRLSRKIFILDSPTISSNGIKKKLTTDSQIIKNSGFDSFVFSIKKIIGIFSKKWKNITNTKKKKLFESKKRYYSEKLKKKGQLDMKKNKQNFYCDFLSGDLPWYSPFPRLFGKSIYKYKLPWIKIYNLKPV